MTIREFYKTDKKAFEKPVFVFNLLFEQCVFCDKIENMRAENSLWNCEIENVSEDYTYLVIDVKEED